jgi:hypothetical protein
VFYKQGESDQETERAKSDATIPGEAIVKNLEQRILFPDKDPSDNGTQTPQDKVNAEFKH